MVSDLKTFALKWCNIAAGKKLYFCLANFPLLAGFFWYQCYFPHRLRDASSPLSGFFSEHFIKVRFFWGGENLLVSLKYYKLQVSCHLTKWCIRDISTLKFHILFWNVVVYCSCTRSYLVNSLVRLSRLI